MASLRNRAVRPANAPDLRGHLRLRLRGIRDRIVAQNGPYSLLLGGRPFGLDRLELLDEGQAVTVYGHEISDTLNPANRAALDPGACYTLTPGNRLEHESPDG